MSTLDKGHPHHDTLHIRSTEEAGASAEAKGGDMETWAAGKGVRCLAGPTCRCDTGPMTAAWRGLFVGAPQCVIGAGRIG